MSKKEIWVLILGIIVIFLLYVIAHQDENMNFYQVQLGQKELSYEVIEDTTRFYIRDVFDGSSKVKAYYDKGLAKIDGKDVTLAVVTYSCNNQVTSKKCSTYYKSTQKGELTRVAINPSTLTILKDDKKIYDGEYITDLSSYMKEKGRYYFIVTIKQNLFRKEKVSKLLFTVKVGV